MCLFSRVIRIEKVYQKQHTLYEELSNFDNFLMNDEPGVTKQTNFIQILCVMSKLPIRFV